MKLANMEAAHVFKPIREAAQQLAQELSGNEHIMWTMRDQDVDLTLGQERRVRVSREGWQATLLSRTPSTVLISGHPSNARMRSRLPMA